MKKELTVLSCFCAAFLLTTSQSCLAVNSNANNQAQANTGNPLDALSALIAENRELIEANRGAITALEEETDAINTRIDGIQAELSEVASQVTANSADISNAFTRIAAAEGDINTLRNDLGTLAVQHQADIAGIEARLDDIQTQIDALVVQGAALANELNSRVAELRASINDNAVGIDALVVDISLLNAQVSTINTDIIALSNQQNALTDQVADQSQQLTNLNAALAELKARVDSYHGIEDSSCLAMIAIGSTVTGELIDDGECTSDSRNYGGTHGARYYTFTIANPATISIAMNGSCYGDSTLDDPYLYLHLGGRDGELITQDDDFGGCLNSLITQTLQPGTYTIEATSFWFEQYGTFQLSVL